MATNPKIEIDVELDNSKLSKDLKQSENDIKKFSGITDVALGQMVADIAKKVATGLTEIGKAGVLYNAQMETYQALP